MSAPYGQVTIDGLPYIERPQLFVAETTITQPFQILTNQRLSMPGIADFLLKGLSRTITQTDVYTRFRFRLVNSEGTTWYFSGGLGIFDDRVIDTLCFGSGQFPYPLIPPIPLHASGNLIYEVEDIGLALATDYPYTIQFGFHGVFLIPANGAPHRKARK